MDAACTCRPSRWRRALGNGTHRCDQYAGEQHDETDRPTRALDLVVIPGGGPLITAPTIPARSRLSTVVVKRAQSVRRSRSEPPKGRPAARGILLQAWIGYRRRLDEELTAAGFPDRAIPDGRVLKLCVHPDGTTISAIGRELGITRQGESKIVAALHRDHYVTVRAINHRR